MVALSVARSTLAIITLDRDLPIEANVTCWQGGMVQVNAAGRVVPASATIANRTLGLAVRTVNNVGGAAGAATVKVRRGTFRYANSTAGDLLARLDIGATCYVVDDQTVAKTNNAGARPAAGIVHDVDAQGVWVTF